MKALIPVLFVLGLVCPAGSAPAAPAPGIAKTPYCSALSINAETGEVLFEDNADAQVYPASVLKLMDLYIVLSRIESGKLALSDMVQVTPEAAGMGGSQVYLDEKEQFPVEELLYALMVQSANDAATALAIHIAGSREAFVGLMNQTAQELGMTHTTFHSEHGLPPGKGQEPDVTTARDMAILCRELVKRPNALHYTSTITRGFRNDQFIMHNHNKLLGLAPGVDGLKTGYFRQAGYSIAATAPQNGQRVITLVMGSASAKERDAKALEILRTSLARLPPRAEAPKASQPAQPQHLPSTPQEAAPAVPGKTAARGPLSAGWGKFFLGLGIGLLVFVGIILTAGRYLRNQRSRGMYLRRR